MESSAVLLVQRVDTSVTVEEGRSVQPSNLKHDLTSYFEGFKPEPLLAPFRDSLTTLGYIEVRRNLTLSLTGLGYVLLEQDGFTVGKKVHLTYGGFWPKQ